MPIGRAFRQTRITGKLAKAIQIVRQVGDKLSRPGEADQYDFRLGQGSAQSPQSGRGTKQVSELKCAEKRDALGHGVAESKTTFHGILSLRRASARFG